MCGLVGATAQQDVIPVLMDGLKRLEYRGYDSAGLSLLDDERDLSLHRCVGKVADLQSMLGERQLFGLTGIGHTRWATHGKPSELNAHPHVSNGSVAVAHNGIIENHGELREQLIADGYGFVSETDTEVIAHLVHRHLDGHGDLIRAVSESTHLLSGSYAIAVISPLAPNSIVIARHSNPLVIGVGNSAQYAASDLAALLPVTQQFMFLEDGDVAQIGVDNIDIIDRRGHKVVRPAQYVDIPADAVDKGPYQHFMLKEIHEQPKVLNEILTDHVTNDALLPEIVGFRGHDLLGEIEAIQIVACGTSYHAAEVAKYWFESIAEVPCMVDLASEFRYRLPVVPDKCLFLAVSQSGETADTLAALRFAKAAGYLASMSICNVPSSSMVRESDISLLTRAGPEIGVASTKAFTTQLLSLLMLTVMLGNREWENRALQRIIIRQMRQIGNRVESVLEQTDAIKHVAEWLAGYDHALFLGRGTFFPIAKEGALKLKEISYIHAEAYAGGELKHGPLALVDEHMPVIVLAPTNQWLEKIKSNLLEVQARDGQVVVFTDEASCIRSEPGLSVVTLPRMTDLAAPIGYAAALQLLAYHTAVVRGTDVDQPRNLAKSVTVE